jgi:hypothetical protein
MTVIVSAFFPALKLRGQKPAERVVDEGWILQ